jgi:hypothetical protein
VYVCRQRPRLRSVLMQLKSFTRGFPSSHRRQPVGREWRWRQRALSTGLQIVIFGVAPAMLIAFQLRALVAGHLVAVDFTHGPWVAGRHLLAGVSPYVAPHSGQLQGIAFVYPAVAALLLAPFSLLSHSPAGVLFTGLNLVAVPLTLRALNVTDWRVYGAIMLWPAIFSGWETANVTLLLGLGIALAWRWRDRPVVCGALVALLISAKLFLWPLIVWLVATRRLRACGHAVAIGVAMNVLAWGVLGFDQIAKYAHLIGTLSTFQENRGYSVMALAMNRGVDRSIAYGAMVTITALLVAGCLVAGRRSGGRPALALAIGASILGSPITWLHYFALLLIPLALARPRLSVMWLLPVFLWFPTLGPNTWQILTMIAVGGAITALTITTPEPERSPSSEMTPVANSGPSAPGSRSPPAAITLA